jgi:CshA-type fibril repeat protein
MSSATAFFTVDPVAFNVTGSGTGPAPIVVTPPAPTGTGPFAYSLTSLPPGSDGIASMDPSTGQITFTPTAVFSGVVTTFTYTVIDAADDVSAPADIVLTVDLPALPVAVDDTYTTIANTAINQVASGGLLSNDTGASPAVTGHTAPTHGTVTVNADGSFLYTPTAGYSGPDSFGYTDTDAYGRMSSATAFFTVDPVAFNVTGSGTGPAPIVVTPPAPIGTGPFTYTLVTAPPVGNGIAMMDATSGVITFTPAVGFSGVVTTFTYTITDAADDVSAPANIVLTVDLPALPVAVDDTYATTANTAINQIASGGLLSNDTGTSPTVTGHTPPTHGTVTVNADGSFLYTPTAGYSGPDSFGYTDTDAYGRMSSATASITVDPVAMNVTGSGPGPGVIQATPPAPTGTGPFTYTLVTTPPGSDGTATMDPTTGVITFTPNAGFHGTVPTFTYTVTDASDDVSVPADIDLSVGLPTPPVAQNVSGTTPANVSITRTPAAPTGTGPFTFALATTPSASDGVAIIDPTTGAVTFTPAHDFSGIVPSFTYTATDADDQVSEPADVSIDVTPLDAPASGSGPPEKPITVQPPAPVGTGPFTYTLVPGSLPPAADGTVSIDPTTGAITFTPAPGFTGTTTVEYTVTDSDGLTSPAAVVTFDVSGASATVPSTGAMEGPMLAGILLVVLGLLMIVGALVRRTRKFAPNFTPRA